ncbi:hypothetical protein [Candidatus Mesenet endosymbiont of Agriotes lineatus]|uniref:hypothetical protein n=1 Tax=Candidatus Mesenet endosymbiont of Agriotes lineatus TaxID=3077948 RepID=UPI0030D1930F
MSFINLLNILIYFYAKYYITKDFFFNTKYKHKEDIILKRRKKILTKRERLEDKIILYSLTLLHIGLLAIELWAVAQYHFNIHDDISSYYYEKQLQTNYMFLLIALMLTVITFTLFSLYNAKVMLKKSKHFRSHEHCFFSIHTPPLLPTLTDDVALKLPSSPRSLLPSYNTPKHIQLLPSPTPSSGVFLFPSISPSSTLKVKDHPVLPLVEDIIPKLLDAPKPSSCGVGSLIRSLQISKSKVSLSSRNVSTILESSISSRFFLKKVKSWPSLYNEEEPPESVFLASADDMMQQTPSTPREWTPPSSSLNTLSSSTLPYLTSSSSNNDLRFLGLSSSLSPGSCMHSFTKFSFK